MCLVVVLLILIQRTSGGMGSALGGGAADQVLGAGSAAQLTKLTVASIAGFFVLSFALYALYQSEAGESEELQRLGTDEPALLPSAVPSIPIPSQPGNLLVTLFLTKKLMARVMRVIVCNSRRSI